MRPLTIITGVVLGSSASITLGLLVVMIIYFFTGLEEPRVADEFAPLLGSVLRFLVLTAISAASFVATLKEWRWRWPAQALMWLTLVLIARYYWP